MKRIIYFSIFLFVISGCAFNIVKPSFHKSMPSELNGVYLGMTAKQLINKHPNVENFSLNLLDAKVNNLDSRRGNFMLIEDLSGSTLFRYALYNFDNNELNVILLGSKVDSSEKRWRNRDIIIRDSVLRWGNKFKKKVVLETYKSGKKKHPLLYWKFGKTSITLSVPPEIYKGKVAVPIYALKMFLTDKVGFRVNNEIKVAQEEKEILFKGIDRISKKAKEE